jgi:hypothetical protein
MRLGHGPAPVSVRSSKQDPVRPGGRIGLWDRVPHKPAPAVTAQVKGEHAGRDADLIHADGPKPIGKAKTGKPLVMLRMSCNQLNLIAGDTP